MSTTKIPVRDLKPMFNLMERTKKENFSATFNPPNPAEKKSENSRNKILKNLLLEKEKEVKDLKKIVEKLQNSLQKSSKPQENEEKMREMEKENCEMKNDLKMLKTLVFRLNKHIEYYQELLNEKKTPFTPPQIQEEENSWKIHSNILQPLMDSYEERIKEKNEIIKSYELELTQFTGKLKQVFEENEKIQELHETQAKNSEMWLMEKQRLTSQNEILHEKAKIHAKRADLAKEKLYEVLKVYEQKMQAQQLDIERLQEAYNRSKGEISTLKSLQKNPDEFSQQLRECQKLLEDYRMQFEVEKAQLIDEKKMMESELREARERVGEFEVQMEKQKMFNEWVNFDF